MILVCDMCKHRIINECLDDEHLPRRHLYMYYRKECQKGFCAECNRYVISKRAPIEHESYKSIDEFNLQLKQALVEQKLDQL